MLLRLDQGAKLLRVTSDGTARCRTKPCPARPAAGRRRRARVADVAPARGLARRTRMQHCRQRRRGPRQHLGRRSWLQCRRPAERESEREREGETEGGRGRGSVLLQNATSRNTEFNSDQIACRPVGRLGDWTARKPKPQPLLLTPPAGHLQDRPCSRLRPAVPAAPPRWSPTDGPADAGNGALHVATAVL